ncbi:hypothetical protein [Pseudomonas sp. JUb52]|uniref:hypothetical protein n=1 Tax=Pseudomonas sp. JUb52 TaxID=2485127 RepID=UPI0010492052|nr:hypothetical protein [Pseudomonas sp. JUb52]
MTPVTDDHSLPYSSKIVVSFLGRLGFLSFAVAVIRRLPGDDHSSASGQALQRLCHLLPVTKTRPIFEAIKCHI